MKKIPSATFVFIVIVCFHNNFSNSEPLQGPNVVEAKDFEFPSLVSIRHKNLGPGHNSDHICTGVSITKRHILTAAHCVLTLDVTKAQVSAGSADLRYSYDYDIRSAITYNRWIFGHEKPLEVYDHDVAVLTLWKELDSRKIRQARLSARPTESNYGLNVVVAGWGRLVDGKMPETMRRANVKVLSQHECERIISLFENKPVTLDPRYLCSKNEPHALLTCGDSGSPLMLHNDIIVGISKGTCPLPGQFHPDLVNLHASINNYILFIRQVTRGYDLHLV